MFRQEPIFLHTSFRTSSTWLWEKFRSAPGVLAYCEPFNEFLGTATGETLAEPRPDNWSSGHPACAPYFLEYGPLLCGTGGVKGFCPDFSFQRFVPEDGVRGSLGIEERVYLQALVDHGLSQTRTPFLAFTRSLGRMAGIKAAFGGAHLFLYRPLLDQWLSYLSQREQGREYFVQTLVEIVVFGAARVPLFQRLIDMFWVGGDGPGNYYGFRDIDAAFEVFLVIHLYLYAHATGIADIVIDGKRLAAESDYRRSMETRIAEGTGVALSLEDAVRRVQPAQLPGSGAFIDRARDLVLEQLRADGVEGEEFVVSLADDVASDIAFSGTI